MTAERLWKDIEGYPPPAVRSAVRRWLEDTREIISIGEDNVTGTEEQRRGPGED